MEPHDLFLLHAGRNLSARLDQQKQNAAAATVNDLVVRLETLVKKADDSKTVTIEQAVFKQLFESAGLFMFLIDNIGRISLSSELIDGMPKFSFRLNPPGRRQQFLRQDVIQALMDIREVLKAPQFG